MKINKLFYKDQFKTDEIVSDLKERSEAYSEPCQTSKIELFAKIVHGSTILIKNSILVVLLGSEYTP